MVTYKVGNVNVKGIGNLPEIAADEVTPITDKMVVWDASAPEGDRLRAIRINQLPMLVDRALNGNAALQFEKTFGQGDLSIAGILPVIHDLNSSPSGCTVYDPDGIEVEPDRFEVVSPNAIAIHLASFTPLMGAWKVSLTS